MGLVWARRALKHRKRRFPAGQHAAQLEELHLAQLPAECRALIGAPGGDGVAWRGCAVARVGAAGLKRVDRRLADIPRLLRKHKGKEVPRPPPDELAA